MLTIVIPTFKNEDSIESVLQSVEKIADQIIVIDSYSTDNTLQIAKKYQCLIYQREYQYSASQKNWILDKIKTEWTMVVDSDEILSEGLVSEITQWKNQAQIPDILAFKIPFIHYLWGKPVTLKTDWKIKLFRTKLFRFEDKLVHAHPTTSSIGKILSFNNPVYHFGIKSIQHWASKMNIYSSWDSIERAKRKDIAMWEIITKPLLLFCRSYIIEKSFLFGFRGIVWSLMKAVLHFNILLKQYENKFFKKENYKIS